MKATDKRKPETMPCLLDRSQLRVMDALEHIHESGRKRLVVYGAGKHTRKHLPLLDFRDLQVLGIIDDCAEQPRPYHHYTLYPTASLPSLKADAVLISSDAYEPQMYRTLRRMAVPGAELFRVYHPSNEPGFLHSLLMALERLAKAGVSKILLYEHADALLHYRDQLRLQSIEICGVITDSPLSVTERDNGVTVVSETAISPPEGVEAVVFIDRNDYNVFRATAGPGWGSVLPLIAVDRRVSEDTARKLNDAVLELIADGHENIAVYGAGKHTLKGLSGLAVLPDVVSLVIDDSWPHQRFCGWPVQTSREAKSNPPSCLLVSSDTKEDMLCRKAASLFGGDTKIKRLYLRALVPDVATPAKPSILLATDIKFWIEDKGSSARIAQMLKYICREGSFVPQIYYGCDLSLSDIEQIRRQYPDLILHYNGVPASLLYDLRKDVCCTESLADFYSKVQQQQFHTLLERLCPAAAIVECIRLAFLMDDLPTPIRASCIFAIDTLDVMHRRMASFRKAGLEHWLSITREEEAVAVGKFDVILAIQEPERELLQEMAPRASVMCVPHAHTLVDDASGSSHAVPQVGFFATSSQPNIQAITTFLDEVWPALPTGSAELHIYGTVCAALDGVCPSRRDVHLHGFVPDLDSAYAGLDVAINPVSFGGGLKIKNVEALCRGKALITTPHGALSMEDGRETAFLAPEGRDEFVNALQTILTNPRQREELAQGGLNYARQRFSSEIVYGELIRTFKEKMNSPNMST